MVIGTREGDEYRDIQSNILAREAVLSGVIGLNERNIERVEFEGFQTSLSSDAFSLIEGHFLFALDSVSNEARQSAITGTALLESLVEEDAQAFAGVFNGLFADLNSLEIDAYRKAVGATSLALDASGNYLDSFNIGESGEAFRPGVVDTFVATRMGIGAAVKTHALAKTVVAQGRYGKGSDALSDWKKDQVLQSNSVALEVTENLVAVAAITPTAGYLRFENTQEFSLRSLLDDATQVLGEALEGSGFGKIGVKAERIGKSTAARIAGYIGTNAVAGPYLQDQLLLPFALAGGGSFTSVKISDHTRTAADIIQRFTDRRVTFEDTSSAAKLVTVR